MTRSELMIQLDRAGVEYPSDARKSVLEELLSAALPEVAPTPFETARPVWEGGETRQQYRERLHAWKLERASRP